MFGAGQSRVAIVQPVHIAQQHDALCSRRLRHARGETVIVAETNLLGRYAVILVEHRHHAQSQQPVERGGGVKVAAAGLQIIERDQDLRRREPLCAERLRPYLAERDLPDSGGGLRIFEARASAFGQAQPPRTERDRTRGHDRHLLPSLGPHGDIGGDAFQPIPPHAAIGIDEQRRPDLDDQARAGFGRKEQHRCLR